jgi:hypothetical protein
MTNDNCTILPRAHPRRRERLSSRIPSRDSAFSPVRGSPGHLEAPPAGLPPEVVAVLPEISEGATTFRSRRSCTRWGAAKDASPKNRPEGGNTDACTHDC